MGPEGSGMSHRVTATLEIEDDAGGELSIIADTGSGQVTLCATMTSGARASLKFSDYAAVRAFFVGAADQLAGMWPEKDEDE